LSERACRYRERKIPKRGIFVKREVAWPHLIGTTVGGVCQLRKEKKRLMVFFVWSDSVDALFSRGANLAGSGKTGGNRKKKRVSEQKEHCSLSLPPPVIGFAGRIHQGIGRKTIPT